MKWIINGMTLKSSEHSHKTENRKSVKFSVPGQLVVCANEVLLGHGSDPIVDP